MLKSLFSGEANEGEAAGYSYGLIKCCTWDEQAVAHLISVSDGSLHDRIARSSMMGLALVGLRQKSKVGSVFEDLYRKNDYVLRMGAASLLGMAYVGTGDEQSVSVLLKMCASDLSSDVRRAATFSIGLILIKEKQRAFELMKMLKSSYNEFVRHAVALTLGVLFAGTYNKEVTSVL